LHFLRNNKLLVCSLLANLVLAYCVVWTVSKLQQTYKHYRFFRAQEIGISAATSVDGPLPANSMVLFGDSRVETWGPKLESNKLTFVNAGVVGETTTEMRMRFEHDVLRLKPDYVLIQAGMNDLTASVTKTIQEPAKYIEDMHSNLEYFISTLETNDIDVIVTSVIPAKLLSPVRRLFWHNQLNAKTATTNEWLRKTALKHNADWIDLDPLYLDGSNKPINALFYDTLHINQEGYELLNQNLYKHFETL